MMTETAATSASIASAFKAVEQVDTGVSKKTIAVSPAAVDAVRRQLEKRGTPNAAIRIVAFDEHDAGFHIFRGMRTYAQRGIVPQFDRFRFAVAQQIERAARFVNLHHLKVHRLAITVDTGGL